MKRCAECMRAQDQILSHLCEDINELMCRARVRTDILLMTQMQTAEPQARVLEETKPTMSGDLNPGKSAMANDNSDENRLLRTVMSTFLQNVELDEVTFKATHER